MRACSGGQAVGTRSSAPPMGSHYVPFPTVHSFFAEDAPEEERGTGFSRHTCSGQCAEPLSNMRARPTISDPFRSARRLPPCREDMH